MKFVEKLKISKSRFDQNTENSKKNEMKKKNEIVRKKHVIVDKYPIISKVAKSCKCEIYEKKIQSNANEIIKLNKELQILKKISEKEGKDNEIVCKILIQGKNQIIEYDKIIDESLNKITELKQNFNLSQEKNFYLEKLLLKKENLGTLFNYHQIINQTKMH